MTVSNVSSVTNPYYTTAQSGFQQRFQDFKALANALQSDDLTSAQNAFAALQKDLQGSSQTSQTSQPFGNNSQANQDFQTLQSTLQSGDLSGAQQAFASLKQDLQGAHQAHHHHHHHIQANNNGDTADNGGTATPTTDLSSSQTGAAAVSTLFTQA